jgi:hypothetical protein
MLQGTHLRLSQYSRQWLTWTASDNAPVTRTSVQLIVLQTRGARTEPLVSVNADRQVDRQIHSGDAVGDR